MSAGEDAISAATYRMVETEHDHWVSHNKETFGERAPHPLVQNTMAKLTQGLPSWARHSGHVPVI